jgi:hypothetical protein
VKECARPLGDLRQEIASFSSMFRRHKNGQHWHLCRPRRYERPYLTSIPGLLMSKCLRQGQRLYKPVIYLSLPIALTILAVTAVFGDGITQIQSYCWAGADSSGTEKYLPCEDINETLVRSPPSILQNFSSEMLRFNLGGWVPAGAPNQK